MIIDVNQKKIAIGDKYDIYINETLTHQAATQLFRFLSEINLFEIKRNEAKFRIKKKWSWFKTTYDIYKSDNQKFEFKTISIWKHHYICQSSSDSYEIFGHRGRKYSVFKNKEQVAWWDKNCVTWFEGDNYRIIADNDSDFELIVSFCLIIDNSSSNSNDGNTVTFDIGNIGPEVVKFDSNWEPKN